MRRRHGFTLIELVIAIAILTILAAIAIPEYGQVLRKAAEAMTKGNLASLRAAISGYYAAHEGQYPTDDLTCLIREGFLSGIPSAHEPPYHPQGNSIGWGDSLSMQTDRNAWFYFSVSTDTMFGHVMVNCIHNDLTGTRWTSY